MNSRDDGPKTGLADKILALEKLNETISEQETRMKSLYAERTALEDEIAILRAHRPGINGLPLEVLTKVFENAILLDPNISCDIPTANRDRINLTLVCKFWQSIVTEAPVLWSTIYIVPPSGYNGLRRWAHSMDQYTQVCLSMSRGIALDTVFDFTDISPGQSHVFNETRSLLSDLVDYESLDLWLDQVEWNTCPAAQAYDELFMGVVYNTLLKSIVVRNRLGSLRLNLPWASMPCQTYWSIFTFEAKGRPTKEIGDVSGSEETVGDSSLMSKLVSSIRQLSIHHFILPNIPILSNLHRLHIWIGYSRYDWTGLRLLQDLPLLRYLVLARTGAISNEAYNDVTIIPITLPTLRCLHLRGDVPPLVLQALQIRDLEKLVTEDLFETYNFFPKAHVFSAAKHVVCRYLTHRTDQAMRHLLSSLFIQLSVVHTIVFQPWVHGLASQQAKIHQNQGLLRSLRSVISEEMEPTPLRGV